MVKMYFVHLTQGRVTFGDSEGGDDRKIKTFIRQFYASDNFTKGNKIRYSSLQKILLAIFIFAFCEKKKNKKYKFT